MKGFILLACIVTITALAQDLTDEETQRIKTVHSECQADPNSHLDEEILKKFHRRELTDNKVIGPHTHCMYTKLGFIKENGDINKEVLRIKLAHSIKDEEKLKKAVEECAVKKTTPEETALELLKCFHKHTSETNHVQKSHDE